MELVFSVVQVIICVVLIFLDPHALGEGRGAVGRLRRRHAVRARSGGGSLVERNLNRWTVGFAIAFALNTILLIKQPW